MYSTSVLELYYLQLNSKRSKIHFCFFFKLHIMHPEFSITSDLLKIAYYEFSFTTMGSFWGFVFFYFKILSAM